MKSAILLTLIVGLLSTCIAQQTEKVPKEIFKKYKALNDQEKKLLEYKDSDEMLRAKLIQLNLINQSRKKYNAPPVALDILASRVANKMSKEAAENDFRGHWNLRGEKPYHRYAFAGGFDHVSENAAARWTEGTFDQTIETHQKFMRDLHLNFMNEKKPYDGHKQTVINKDHNFVGIGCHLTENQFRYYEEYLDRYLEFVEVPTKAKAGETVNIKVKAPKNQYLFFATVYYERFPKPMQRNKLNRQNSYEDYTSEIVRQIPPWELAKFRKGNEYSIPFAFNKNGLYYIHLYIDKDEINKPQAVDTKEKKIVSGIVVRVE